MQLTIDVDKNFIESLREEFNTHNIKDALYQLLDFYKQKNSHSKLSIEIDNRIKDYKSGLLETNAFREDLDNIRNNILKK
jgi:hypothetical protein